MLIVMAGCPGSGKSFTGKLFADAEYVSSDEIREELLGSAEDQSNGHKIFEVFNQRVLDAVSEGKNVVADATFSRRADRKKFLELFPEDLVKICYFVDTDLELCFLRNESRERTVPREVITKMHDRLRECPPTIEEGWDAVMRVLD